MRRAVLAFVLAFAGAPALSSGQPLEKQERGVKDDPKPVERQIGRSYIIEGLTVGFLVVGAVFAVGRTSRRV